MVGVAFVAATGSLSFFDLWIPTPSYNSLTFQSLMLAAIGALMTRHEMSKASFAGWTLVGLGVGVAFLAKASSAAVLCVLLCIYLAIAGTFRIRGAVISTACAILVVVVAALSIDGSLSTFLRRIVLGMELAQRISPHLLNIFRWDDVQLSDEQKLNFTYLATAAFLATFLGFARNGLARSVSGLIAIATSGLVIATTVGMLAPRVSYEPFQPMQLGAVSLGLGAAALLFHLRIRVEQWRTGLALIALFAVLPYAYASGTGGGYWIAASRAGFFWLLIGIVVCAGAAANIGWQNMLPGSALAIAATTCVLYVAMENPYRQTAPLRLQESIIEIVPGKSHLFLAGETGAYIRELRRIAASNGFKPGDPMLDLSGVSPGSLYVIGARPLGVAWTLGGYPGSSDFLRGALGLVSCKVIAESWILFESDPAAFFDPEIMRGIGIDISTDYSDVGSIASIRSFAPRQFEQRLLRPARSPGAGTLACENARRADASSPNELRAAHKRSGDGVAEH